MSDDLRYRFGPLEQRGFLFGLRTAQVGLLFGGAFLGVIAMHAISGSGGIVLAFLFLTAAAGSCFWHVSGRSVDQWVPVGIRWVVRQFKKENVHVSQAPLRGHSWKTPLIPKDAPPSLKTVSILAAPVAGGELGIVKDELAGTYTAVLAVRGRSFALLDQQDKARLLSQWGDVLTGLAREGSPITRLQWLERTSADGGETVAQYLRESVKSDYTSPAVRSYLQLIEEAGPVARRHETYLAVQIDGLRARRAIRQSGGGDTGASLVLAREIYGLATRLQSADLDVLGLLTPQVLAETIRTAYDPAARNALAMRSVMYPDEMGVDPAHAWPMKTVSHWDHLASDSAVHATYWCAEWPRTDVGPDFLAPLLLQTWVHRTVSVTMEPVSPLKAQREVESARTADIADAEVRQKHGFITTMRRQRQHEGVLRREQELADGHADIRFSGYITVTAANQAELEVACSEVEQQAGQSRIVLRRLSGEHDVAFTYTLPLARGLR